MLKLAQFDDLQTELTRLQSAPHGEVVVCLDLRLLGSFQTSFAGAQSGLPRSETLDSGKSGPAILGSAETGSSVVHFLQQNSEMSFFREGPTVPESSTSGLQHP
eukprot:gene29531-38646_t